MALAIEFSLAAEFANQPLTTEETADQAGSRFSDFEVERVFVGNDVSGVDGETAIDIDFVDSAEAVQEQVPLARALDPEHTLAAEQSFAKTPSSEASQLDP